MSARPAHLSTLLAAGLTAVLAVTMVAPARDAGDREPDRTSVELVARESTNKPTPGAFTGYGFDQCLAPTQKTMDTWMEHSPFKAVGIYISGNSRHCRDQPNLTPAWVSRQLARGWHLLPITLGPQASCATRYPKYGKNIDPTINPDSSNNYRKARVQGKKEAEKAVSVAGSLGIVPKSTLFYDLEAFDIGQAACRMSAIQFVHAWSKRLKELGYKSGFYSSAASGIKMLDDIRRTHPGKFVLPNTLWIARWDGKANTTVSTSYLGPKAWLPGRRVKQYQGGHDEKWGGVTINIDRNFLDLGGMVAASETHCGGIAVDLASYPTLRVPTATATPPAKAVKALQCLLTEKKLYTGKIHGRYDAPTRRAAQAWQVKKGFPARNMWGRRDWMTLSSAGSVPVLKYGSTGAAVRRAQRAMNAAMPARKIKVNGVFDATMATHVGAYRRKIGMTSYNIVSTATWKKLQAGKH
ncbi:peptidoglycan hydrolase-like protein with peptidoglycan-binding domain [Nocardioides sp. J9]|uniref:glycoside hydrolase domain-containing protein n=1 Tax=Nocardioides sp. J9 TaxID=935844 RepID=UPI0011A122A5|nr:glycoside hydrolase domain-containing protein [Nocardioides sp. J9]TWG98233.1 peptidoglycan hydrolase-like protein with peptidoglycan-binding domain [Nocardioides sp. J9]